ncbi:hypothetical protein [Paraburkholderia sp. BCC1884]|uniref:hypothetical protein n=1 Tax=Paraburkholderia sp. BCC1884 TaxID=2562668 RepID=UPI00118361A3|nr:hypothetical protein [Paraburkholderia sp. BCC1884]
MQEQNSQSSTQADPNPAASRDPFEVSEEVKARNKPSGTHYIEPSPLGIEPVEQTGVDKATNPPRSSERPTQSPEVPLGTGNHGEPAGGGGRESQRKV